MSDQDEQTGKTVKSQHLEQPEQELSEFEMAKLCAEAIRLQPDSKGGSTFHIGHDLYDPLHKDAQAAVLVKHFSLCVWGSDILSGGWKWHAQPNFAEGSEHLGHGASWNHAIVECVAKMQREVSVSAQENETPK